MGLVKQLQTQKQVIPEPSVRSRCAHCARLLTECKGRFVLVHGLGGGLWSCASCYAIMLMLVPQGNRDHPGQLFLPGLFDLEI